MPNHLQKQRLKNSKLGPDLKNNLFVVNFRNQMIDLLRQNKKHLQLDLYNLIFDL